MFTAVQAHTPIEDRDWERSDWETAPREMLEAEITTFAAHLNAATAQWLSWVAIYDRHGYAQQQGFSCTAGWLNYYCGITPVTARTHVRVARALDHLPKLKHEFEAGYISYSKVRVISAVATAENEDMFIQLAPTLSASQLSKVCATHKRNLPKPTDDTLPPRLLRSRDNNDGTTTLMITVPTEEAQQAKRSIRSHTDVLIADATPPGGVRMETVSHHGGLGAFRAEAAIDLLVSGSGARQQVATKPTDATLVVPADAAPTDRGSAQRCGTIGAHPISNPATQQLLCDPRITALVEDANGDPAAVSSPTRLIGTKLRRMLEHRDNHMCQFPGCSASERLHAHHIKHWADGGPTELDNLVLVCHFHHGVIHKMVIAGRKWTIDPITRQFRHPSCDKPQPRRSRGIVQKTLQPKPLPADSLYGYQPLHPGGVAQRLASFEVGDGLL